MKYVGSKNRIAKYIVPIIQSKDKDSRTDRTERLFAFSS